MTIAPPRDNPWHELECKHTDGVFMPGRDWPRLTYEAKKWLETNTTARWWIRPGNSVKDLSGPVVGFESTRDAALFKLFWW